jgi:polar amino acid transport system substrate-binding protein
MMKLSRRFAMTAAAAVMFGFAVHAQAEGIKFGVAAEPYPPFSSKDSSGKWVGWEMDLMNAVCKQMNEQCELVEVAWDGIIPALTSKQIDVIWSSMSITDERKKTIDFSDMYYDTATAIIGPKNGDLDISPEHLKGKTIGVQVSTTHANYVDKYYGAGSTVKTYQTQDEANQDLAAGRLDYVQADALALAAFVKTEQGAACCEKKAEVPPDSSILGFGVGGGIRKEDTALKDKINAAIHALAAAGEIEKITANYPELQGGLVIPKN